MEKNEIIQKILEKGIIAILRTKDPAHILPSAMAILEGGIKTIEVSFNTPDALGCISQLTEIDGVLPGGGTITSAKMAKDAINAGAEFIVTPITKKEIIDTCHDLDKPVFSGAFTPSEIFQAHEWGADFVKVFPASALGMNYIKIIKTPFPEIKLFPTGGVNTENIDQWFDAGADCVGIGGCFTKESILANAEWGRQTSTAKELVTNLDHYLNTRNQSKY